MTDRGGSQDRHDGWFPAFEAAPAPGSQPGPSGATGAADQPGAPEPGTTPPPEQPAPGPKVAPGPAPAAGPRPGGAPKPTAGPSWLSDDNPPPMWLTGDDQPAQSPAGKPPKAPKAAKPPKPPKASKAPKAPKPPKEPKAPKPAKEPKPPTAVEEPRAVKEPKPPKPPKEPKAPKPPKEPGSGRTGLLIGGAVALVAVVAGGIVLATMGSRGGNDVDGKATAAAPTSADAGAGAGAGAGTPAADWCTPSDDGTTVVGNGPGGFADGPDAIMGFEYGIFVERNATKALEHMVPNALHADQVQATAIDPIEVGTQHCLSITKSGPESYDLTITRMSDSGEKLDPPWTNRVRTATLDGRTLVVEMVPA
ncbi:hypothetical protein [Rhodococcus sp. HNM0569]|uniref:hypothetical protein n=1 Tax=Rhodococcus sp. HNM0569 TaxID=2716340 RepID=UPI00146D0828|nr:hypothetical protein [Rhodococcus sp. HNM0569]NLU85010.1 hypothetical protein [Rhodococcus sp. HNM0569]